MPSARGRRCRVVAGHVLAVPCSAPGGGGGSDAAAPPLAGIRVVDLSQMLAGPGATQLLGDQGADVIKVESLEGDPMRSDSGSAVSSPVFCVANRNKRAIAIDLKRPEGLLLLKRLVATADVMIQNFRPGVVDRLGIGYEAMRAIRKDIIYVSSSGFGQDGPYSRNRAYDPMIQAASGLPSLQADEAGRPKMMRLLIPDKLTAMTSAQAISTALVQKMRTGRGCHIQISMLDAVVSWEWAEAFAQYTFAREGDLGRGGPAVPGHPYMRDMIYQTQDGYITCGANQQKEWLALCDALGKPEWKDDPRFRTARAREENRWLRLDMTEEVLRTMPTSAVLRTLHDHQVPAQKVNHPRSSVITDEQVQHNALIFEYDHPHTPTGRVRSPRPAAQFGGSAFQLRYGAPILGEHTVELLGELGVTGEEARSLHDRGIVKIGLTHLGTAPGQ